MGIRQASPFVVGQFIYDKLEIVAVIIEDEYPIEARFEDGAKFMKN